MKFFTQIVLPLVIVMALIGGVTFLSHYAGSQSKTTKPGSGPLAVGPGDEFDLMAVGDSAGFDEDGPTFDETELNRSGMKEFWFKQTSGEQVELGLQSKNSACAHVSVMCVTHGNWKEVNRLSASVAALWIGEGHAGATPTLAATALAGSLSHAQWYRGLGIPYRGLEEEGRPVPCAASHDTPSFCVVRLHWQVATPGPLLVKADIWSQRRDQPRRVRSLEQRVLVVPGLQAAPAWVQLKDLNAKGQRAAASFTCWSPTRNSFPLTATDSRNHPAYVCTTEPLTELECRNVAKDQKSAVRSGYRVSVTVTESEQLDLGPFSREIVLRSEAGDAPLTVRAFGLVRGPVKVGTPAEPDIVDLGAFSSRKGAAKSVPVVLQGTDGKLTVDSWSPEYLEVKLEPRPAETDALRWELFVRAPGGAVVGKLPAASTVFLKVHGATPRRLRIPIMGQGTQ